MEHGADNTPYPVKRHVIQGGYEFPIDRNLLFTLSLLYI